MHLGKHVFALCCILAFMLVSFSTAKKKYTQYTAIKWCNWSGNWWGQWVSWRWRCDPTVEVTLPAGECYVQHSHTSWREKSRKSSTAVYYIEHYLCSWWDGLVCYRKKSWNKYHTTYFHESYTTYSSEKVCCYGYVGNAEDNSCLPVCSPSCNEDRGFCYTPGVCKCYRTYEWEGDRCRDDVSLGKWCKSIENEDIKSSHLDSTILEKVYCTNHDETGIEYSSTKAKSVSEKMIIDSDRVKSKPTSTKHWLYKFWRHHPIVRSYCCNRDTEVYTEYLNTLLKFDTTTFGKHVDALSSQTAIELRKELDSLCTSGALSDSFCPLKEILELVDKAPSSLSSWTTEHKNVYRINFILLKKKHHPSHFADIDITPEQEQTILMDSADYILGAYKRNEIAELKTISKYLPSDRQYKQGQLCNNDNLCIFLKIVEAVRKYIREVNLYENPPKIGGRIRRVVPTGVNFIAFLEHTQLDRITKLGSNQQKLSREIANELKKDLSNSFASLSTYFEEVNRFNNRIIQADISDETLQNYKRQLDELLPRVTSAVRDIMDKAEVIVGANVAEKAAILLIKILSAGNPLKWLKGEDPGDTAVDIAEAAAELANAAAGLDKLLRTINAAEELYQKARVVVEGFEENREYLSDVETIVTKDSGADFEQAKEDFLESYGSYNPSVTRPQIAELGSYWEAVITSACEEIQDTSGAGSAIGKSSALQKCLEVNIDVAKMMELYSEIYDLQFDLMDSLAASMRAQNAIEAANKLNQEFKRVNSDTTITTLAMIGSLNYVAYRANVLQAVILYCNILEYKDNFIIKENICKGPSTSIASLVSFIPRSCTVEVQKFYHDIPTKSSGPGDEAYMDVDKLYSGSPVYFKIPNSQWLVDRNWIFTSQKNYAIYVKQFEVYLPTASDRNHNVLVRAMPLMNEKEPGGTVYNIEPPRSLQYDYTEGPTAAAHCHGLKSNLNPYTACLGSSSNTICHNTGEVIREVYPSIYTRWNISMEGYKNTVPPKPANGDFTLKIRLKLCKLSPDHVMAASVGDIDEINPQQMVTDQAESTCCENGQYRSGSYASGGECADCPPESKAALAGYYCDKN